MKKGVKIFVLSLSSIIGVVFIAISVALWIVLTPEKLTPIVREQAPNYLTCETKIDTVDVTFFSSFPKLCLRITNLCLINPTQGAPSDTVVDVEECLLALSISDLLSSKVIVNEFILKDGHVNLYSDSLGNANFDIVKSDSLETTAVADTSAFENPFDLIDIEAVHANNIQLHYVDQSMAINTKLYDSEILLNAQMIGDCLKGEISAQMTDLHFNMSNDFLDATTQKLQLKAPFEYAINSQDAKITLEAEMDSVDFAFEKDKYLTKAKVLLNAPSYFQLANMKIGVDNAAVSVNDHEIHANGYIQMDMETSEIKFDMGYSVEKWNIQKALELVPVCYADYLKGIDVDGAISVSGDLTGLFNDSLLPAVSAHVWLNDGRLTYADFAKYKIRDLNADVLTNIRMNKGEKSSLEINGISCKTLSNSISAKGMVDDLLDKLACNLSANVDVDFADFQSFIPEDLKTVVKGRAKGNVDGKFTLDDVLDLKLERIRANANLAVSHLDLVYDSINVQASHAKVKFNMPSALKNISFKQMLSASIESDTLNYAQYGNLFANITHPDVTVGISDYRDSTKMISAYCQYAIHSVSVSMDDSIHAFVQNPKGTFLLKPARKNAQLPFVDMVWNSDSINAAMGAFVKAHTNTLDLKGGIEMTDNTKDIMVEYNPKIKMNMQTAFVEMDGLNMPIDIPNVDVDISPAHFFVNNCRVNLGRSDFSLKGEFKNHAAFVKKKGDKEKGVAKAEFDLVSHCTDVNALMDITSGLGTSEDSTEIAETVDSLGPHPFIVPKGLDLVLRTRIDTALIGKQVAKNLGGNLYIKNGELILEEMGFVCNAAKLQLTALYKSPRPNHLYVGLNYHMDDIQIAELIDMIPQIDTILPMLRTFNGTGEFHISAGTSLDGYYNLKPSTIRGSCSIQGKDLVLMDNEMFTDISKILLFNKKTENKVDSLSVEFTVFKNDIDVYPFTIVMDKYTAVVGGRQRLDMTYDYHISLLKSPLPMRLGCDIKNTNKEDATDFSVTPAACRYSQRYQRKNSTDTEQKSFRELIRKTLESTDANKNPK